MIGLILLLQTLVVAVSGPTTSPEYLPVRVADAAGLFAREGLSVMLKTTRAEVGAAEALGQGQADLAATSLEAMLRFGPRVPTQAPRLVFGLTAAPPVALIVSSQHAGTVRTIKDLRGKRVGLAAPGAPEHTWLLTLLVRGGLRPNEVDMVSLGAKGLVAALENGEVEAGLFPEPFASRMLAQGHAVLADLRTPAGVAKALGTAGVGAAVFARADRRPADPELAAFTRALLAAEAMLTAGDAATLATQLPPGLVGIPDEFQHRVEVSRGIYLADGTVTPQMLLEGIAVARENQPLPLTLRIPKPSDFLLLGPFRSTAQPLRHK
ncbi:MAG: ABC transporter substrate-binding protein [Candidatus Rokubacteria bacterium]|nr:ABC transporter substrate-binding protein [Candidatus Rokubacteria bacterium]